MVTTSCRQKLSVDFRKDVVMGQIDPLPESGDQFGHLVLSLTLLPDDVVTQRISQLHSLETYRNEIKSYIVRAGMTMTEVVDYLADEYGWSASVPNLSGKLRRVSTHLFRFLPVMLCPHRWPFDFANKHTFPLIGEKDCWTAYHIHH